MNSVLATVQTWHVHPVADHFTIALLITGVVVDLVGSVFFRFRWIRYMALSLMVLGAISIAISWETGGWEAHRVHELVTGRSKALLHTHAEFGDWLIWVFIVIAVCRILVETFRFAAEWRWIYLIVAVIAIGLLGYQGYLGGELVYTYGVGTALLQPAAVATSTPATPTPVPTVFVPSPTPIPTPSPTPGSAPTATPAAKSPAASNPTSTPAATPVPYNV